MWINFNVVFITASTEELYKENQIKKMGRVDQIEKFKLEAQESRHLIYLHSAANGGVTHWGEYTDKVQPLTKKNIETTQYRCQTRCFNTPGNRQDLGSISQTIPRQRFEKTLQGRTTKMSQKITLFPALPQLTAALVLSQLILKKQKVIHHQSMVLKIVK